MSSIADQLEASGPGYDQGERWDWLDKANRSIIPNREVDCSSGCGGIAWLAGYPVDIADPFYTGNFRQKMVAAGFEAIPVKGASLGQILGKLREGDFLLGPGHVIYARTPDRWWSAEGDERGRSRGGKAGDQTGREVRFRAPYARSKGWEWIIRPPAQGGIAEPLASVTEAPAASGGLAVDGQWGKATTTALQRVLKEKYGAWGIGSPLNVDGEMGRHAIRALQRVLNQQGRYGLAEDGIAGPRTRVALQNYLGVRQDGQWGPDTTRALQSRLNANTF